MALDEAETRREGAFEDSGFGVVREGPLWLAFRCGPGPAALSFQLWWKAAPVLAGAMLRVDGRVGERPDARLRYAREGVLEGSAKVARRVRHVRRLEWSGSDLLVLDRVDGLGAHRIESRLVWAPGGDARAEAAVYGDVAGRTKLPADLGFRIRCLE